jgi:CheY-like chemotaxis protein
VAAGNRRKKILVVDDDASFVKLVKLNLEATGQYEVQVETLGSKTLLRAKTFCPDLIFLDVVMPDMLGEDVIRRLETDERTKRIPIVILSGTSWNEGGNPYEYETLKKYPFLEKPVSLQEIIRSIQNNTRPPPTQNPPNIQIDK